MSAILERTSQSSGISQARGLRGKEGSVMSPTLTAILCLTFDQLLLINPTSTFITRFIKLFRKSSPYCLESCV